MNLIFVFYRIFSQSVTKVQAKTIKLTEFSLSQLLRSRQKTITKTEFYEFYFLFLQNFLRVSYKGPGKNNHKDASSVRATHCIPASCGLYYYEVKIVSKGRDGYMGIGLSHVTWGINRLPGWDKGSYG